MVCYRIVYCYDSAGGGESGVSGLEEGGGGEGGDAGDGGGGGGWSCQLDLMCVPR